MFCRTEEECVSRRKLLIYFDSSIGPTIYITFQGIQRLLRHPLGWLWRKEQHHPRTLRGDFRSSRLVMFQNFMVFLFFILFYFFKGLVGSLFLKKFNGTFLCFVYWCLAAMAHQGGPYVQTQFFPSFFVYTNIYF